MAIQCPTCHGSGRAPFRVKLADRDGTCPQCHGEGTIPGRASAGIRAVVADWQRVRRREASAAQWIGSVFTMRTIVSF